MFDMVLKSFEWFCYVLIPLASGTAEPSNKAIQNQLTQYDKARGGTPLLSLPTGCPATGVSPRLGAEGKNEKHEKFS